ncbi:MAG: hypothetical protein IJ317_00070 [Clostridia bacterium]|nr:hypothetical protein [Clostridia bacterium]
MKAVTEHRLGTFIYEESIWTGKKKITWNGVELEKRNRKTFAWYNGVEWRTVTLKGDMFTGIKLYVEEECIQLVPSIKWYEAVCSILILVFNVVWGNTPVLCSIVPIVGGALGGGISGVFVILNAFLMKRIEKVGVKFAVWIGLFLGAFLTCFITALIIFGPFMV